MCQRLLHPLIFVPSRLWALIDVLFTTTYLRRILASMKDYEGYSRLDGTVQLAEVDRRHSSPTQQRASIHVIAYSLLVTLFLGLAGLSYRAHQSAAQADCIRPQLTYCMLPRCCLVVRRYETEFKQHLQRVYTLMNGKSCGEISITTFSPVSLDRTTMLHGDI